MSIDFNADEIFEMAEEIERNGARFYRKAAEGEQDATAQKLLLDLAAREDEHLKLFASMRKDLSKQERTTDVFDPYGESAMYLKAMADGVVFNVKEDPCKKLTGKESMEEILRTAIGLEKDSIVFYLGMREMVPDRLGKPKIEGIIKEEMRHVTDLNRAVLSFRKTK